MTADGRQVIVKPMGLPRVAATILPLVGLTFIVCAALIWGTGGFPPLPTSFARGVAPVIAGMLAAVCYLGAGWLLASRIPRNPIGWLLLAIGLTFAVMTPTALLVDAAHRALRPAPSATVAVAWLVSSFSGPIIIGAGISAGLLFPDGHLAGPRWRRALLLVVIGAILLGFATAFGPSGLIWYPTLPNPTSVEPGIRPVMSLVMVGAALSLVVGAVAMAWSLVGRYRHGDSTARAQLRWILWAGVASAAVLVALLVMRFVYPVGEAMGEAMVASGNATVALLPIAAAVAITRYHLFGIDVIISRTLIYVPVMAILGGLSTALVATFQRIFVAVTGETSDVPIVITVFLVAAAFTPIRKAVEGTVDRWVHSGSAGAKVVEPADVAARRDIEPEIAEVAARVIALRRLEARIADGLDIDRPDATPLRLAIDADGRVACPAGDPAHFLACLGCPSLGGLLTTPPMVMCTFGSPSPAPSRPHHAEPAAR